MLLLPIGNDSYVNAELIAETNVKKKSITLVNGTTFRLSTETWENIWNTLKAKTVQKDN